MNIALVTEFFPPYVTGGAEIFLSGLAKYLESRGHKIIVMTTDQGQGRGEFKDYRIRSSPIRRSHRYQFHGLTVPWMFGNRKLVKQIAGLYKKERIDLVYINNSFHLSFAPLQAADKMGLPAVLDVHDYWPICFSKDMLHVAEPYDPCVGPQPTTKCSRCVARKMGLSKAYIALLPGLLIEKRLRKKWLSSSTIKNVIVHSKEGVEELSRHGMSSQYINYAYLGPGGSHIQSGDGIFRMLFASRLERIRGAHHIAAIARHFKEAGVKFRIDVIGRGSLKEVLDRPDLNIYVHGFMGKERFQLFRKADVMLVLQRYPVPHGITVIESMAHGLPVVAFDGCGAGCLVDKFGAGLTAGNVNGIIKSIDCLRTDKHLVKKIRLNAKRGMKHSDKRTVFRLYERLLSSVAIK